MYSAELRARIAAAARPIFEASGAPVVVIDLGTGDVHDAFDLNTRALDEFHAYALSVSPPGHPISSDIAVHVFAFREEFGARVYYIADVMGVRDELRALAGRGG